MPQADTIPVGTLQDIADQAGAEDFHELPTGRSDGVTDRNVASFAPLGELSSQKCAG